MYSESEIIEMFRAMGLGSSKERGVFDTMRSLRRERQSEEDTGWLFITAACASSGVCEEDDNAELEGNT